MYTILGKCGCAEEVGLPFSARSGGQSKSVPSDAWMSYRGVYPRRSIPVVDSTSVGEIQGAVKRRDASRKLDPLALNPEDSVWPYDGAPHHMTFLPSAFRAPTSFIGIPDASRPPLASLVFVRRVVEAKGIILALCCGNALEMI
ncbi:hypothetical protein EDD17DRAFT_1503035 [Pisolithus thermaeus]|nr:hypothetical protein EDD17DRAFT_1503035 [Pisolithus thermaeus]